MADQGTMNDIATVMAQVDTLEWKESYERAEKEKQSLDGLRKKWASLVPMMSRHTRLWAAGVCFSDATLEGTYFLLDVQIESDVERFEANST